MLENADMLTQLQRPSRSGPKVFWSITESGLQYGKNVTSAQNARETQPHWYAFKFVELLALVGIER